MTELPYGDGTFLFTDVEESTRLLEGRGMAFDDAVELALREPG
jgi:hypothetical protein